MTESVVTPSISFQSLIREAEKTSEPDAELSMDLRIEIRTHGKSVHLWKIALRLSRHIMVTFGKSAVVFMTLRNEELIDTMEDDDGEYWHSLNWGKREHG